MKNVQIIIAVIGLTISCSDDSPKIDPVITWENPSDIAFGTLLSSVQLNAQSNVPGVFTYSPAVGEMLNEGQNQELVVVFTPTEESVYRTGSKTVFINVTSGSNAQFNSGLTYDTVSDSDNNVYKTITIGTQTWMAENLRTTKYRNGESIPEVTSNTEWKNLTSAAYSNYGNTSDVDAIATFGRLYNWFAVTDSRNLAPTGWHVATDADWTTLTTFLGGESVAGGKLKETGTTHWNSPNTGADNSTGFTALPAGRREYTDGSFINTGFNGFWWTSSAYNPDYSWYRQINYDGAIVNPANFHKQYGFAIRCVKD